MGLADAFGVHINADSAVAQATVYSLLFIGIATIAFPIFSTLRVLLSLFVIPGESVRQFFALPMWSMLLRTNFAFRLLNLDLVAPGRS